MYVIRLKRWQHGKTGSTRHKFIDGEHARTFADGYQAALRDLGRTDYTVHVYKDGVPYYESDYTEYRQVTPL